ncbi:hypothetical protein N7491_000016 [Penicillium cf. griseofulvum]|uniref:Uncharacterized protein n=1 Tax=Penicillium cf. griseofulvum TaxID=2972120 RepID=A0A9W9JRY0_9EURO|nr:hypothetical protein N7472_004629 [Penicillium cf. griseofulvum]KAJ5442192.1 hypothetical protein N7445_005199 [Penicillium cf. griseofulvum]KAJ5450834.1 hypothetical protein N7491_000016 [Penicillium cf. griseofulvum]
MAPKRNISQDIAHRKRQARKINDTDTGSVTLATSRRDTVSPRSSITAKTASANDKNGPGPKFIIGLDFGTTMTSVSYYKLKSGKRPVNVGRNAIKSVTHWPGSGRDQSRGEVPTEIFYLGSNGYHWGYEARRHLKHLHSTGVSLNASNRLIRLTKLILENPSLDSTNNDALSEVIETLGHLGKTVKDVITDYLFEVFCYTKKHLKEHENFRETSLVEFSLATPAGWPMRTSWSMQEIVREAAVRASLCRPSEALDLFIINEPEAAAAFALDVMIGTKRLQKGETFLVCDAGGGTVDFTTYTVKAQNPLRLREATNPTGEDHGSTCVNREMEKDIQDRFKSDSESEAVLSEKGISTEYQLFHDVFRKFEEELKRNFDSSRGLEGYEYLDFHGLEPNIQAGFEGSISFESNMIKISRSGVQQWFQPSLEGIARLVQEQLNICEKKKLVMQKVIFVGGYSQSNTFRHFMEQRFQRLQLNYPKDSGWETIVSGGAVYRAIDKSNGPRRKILANIGILQVEEKDRKLVAHRNIVPYFNPCDEKYYIGDCLNWIIKKGREVEFDETFTEKYYQIIEEGQELEIRQRVFYSEKDNIKDHYPLEHEMNRGISESAALIVVDLTELMDQYPLQLKENEGKRYYVVWYDILARLTGRNLEVSLRYPAGQDVRGSAQVCIAASFRPGVA